jgi:hypothetical protein
MHRLKVRNIECKISDFEVKTEQAISNIENQIDGAKKLYDILLNSCVMYFGLHPSQIQDIVITAVIKIILKKHSDLSLEEIEYSFERANITRTVTIVVDDLIKPILEYKKIKLYISEEQKLLNKEIAEQNEKIFQEAKFRKDSEEIYSKSLIEKKWLGTIFHCENLAKRHFADRIDKDLKNKFWMEAQDEYNKIKNNLEPDVWLCNFGKTEIRLFSEKIVLEALNLRLNLLNEK